MRIYYIGNFGPPHSTENHIKQSLEELGHDVRRVQENEVYEWDTTLSELPTLADKPAFVLWTRTWDLTWVDQRKIIQRIKDSGIPVVGYHLDRWWGLSREVQVDSQAFFTSSVVCTADGGHDEQWASRGIEHWWFPPAVNRKLIENLGKFDPTLATDLAFVGSWRGYGHDEWQYRVEMIRQVQRKFGDRLACYPRFNGEVEESRLVGEQLDSIYQSARIIIGDSCLANGATHYYSDRVPETVGRGGFLIHPYVEGVMDGEQYRSGEHLETYELGNFDDLYAKIDHYLVHDAERVAIAEAGREHVLRNHTYAIRMTQLIDELQAMDMI